MTLGIFSFRTWMAAAPVVATLVMGTLAGTASPARAEGKQNFTLVNKTGYVISEVYVSPAKVDDWEEDVLGTDELDNGEAVNIAFSRKEKSCHWDLKVIYDDGESAEWADFDLCAISQIAISYNRKTGETWATSQQ